MKKKIIKYFVLMSALTFLMCNPNAESCKVRIGNSYLDSENPVITDGNDGKVTLEDKNITFENFDYNGKGFIIDGDEASFYTAVSPTCNQDYKITLKGKNTIRFNSENVKADDAKELINTGLYFEDNLEINGEGSLDIYNDTSKLFFGNTGIFTINNLIIKKATINIYNSDASNFSAGIYSIDGLLVENGTLNINGASLNGEDSENYGVYSESGVIFARSNVTINIPDGNNIRGMYTYGDVTINGSNFDLYVGKPKLYSFGFTINDGGLSSSQSIVNAYSYGPVLNTDDEVAFYGSIVKLTSDTGLLNTDYNVTINEPDNTSVLVGSSKDGSDLSAWNKESFLTNYKYLTTTAEKEGTVNTEINNEKINVLTNNIINLVPLTNIEKLKIASGTDITISLNVSDVKEDISNEDIKLIEKNKDKNTIGNYLAIDLIKKIDDKEEKITLLTDKVKFSYELPEELLNADNKVTRLYQIMRVHEGKVDFLPATYNEKTKSVEFETDRFSTYALVYSDSLEENNPQTSDTILSSVLGLGAFISILTTSVILLKKKNYEK